MDEKPIPRWQKLCALALAIIVLLCVIVFAGRIPADFWPPDASRVGPNLLANVIQWALLLILLVLLWPPWRRRLHRFVDRKLAPLHDHHQALRDSHEQLHAKLDRIEQALGHPHATHPALEARADEPPASSTSAPAPAAKPSTARRPAKRRRPPSS